MAQTNGYRYADVGEPGTPDRPLWSLDLKQRLVCGVVSQSNALLVEWKEDPRCVGTSAPIVAGTTEQQYQLLLSLDIPRKGDEWRVSPSYDWTVEKSDNALRETVAQLRTRLPTLEYRRPVLTPPAKIIPNASVQSVLLTASRDEAWTCEPAPEAGHGQIILGPVICLRDVVENGACVREDGAVIFKGPVSDTYGDRRYTCLVEGGTAEDGTPYTQRTRLELYGYQPVRIQYEVWGVMCSQRMLREPGVPSQLARMSNGDGVSWGERRAPGTGTRDRRTDFGPDLSEP